eukprot:6214024-Pleurochrysis_carterae.AAC.2
MRAASFPGWPCSSTRRDAPMSSDANRPSSRLSKPKSAKMSSCMRCHLRRGRVAELTAHSRLRRRASVHHCARLARCLPQVEVRSVRTLQHLVNHLERVPLQLARHFTARDRLVSGQYPPEQCGPSALRHAREKVQIRVNRIDREGARRELQQ